MRALVIGGTRFVGAAIVDELLARGAEVTIFSRGKTNPGMFAGLDHVHGDRKADLGALGERRFDVVFDSCGYTPADVEPAAALAGSMGAFYVFVSSASAYGAFGDVDTVDEDHPLAPIDPDHAVAAPENYGGAKVLCEQALHRALGDDLAIVRPGLIVGPRDYTDRFPYWVRRMQEEGPVLCPGDGEDPTQILDARDFADLMVRLAGRRQAGVFNVAGPGERATFADLIAATTPVGHQPAIVWAPASFLADHDVAPWQDLPCWLPRDHEQAAMLRLDTSRARAAGLVTRPWAETAADTRDTLASRTVPVAGLPRDRERALLELLSRRN